MNGNETGMLNSSGTLAAWYEYDAFDKKIAEGGVSGFEDVNPIQFSTQYTDKETGLVLLWVPLLRSLSGSIYHS